MGPDLHVPVPFAMARREGSAARFVALYEPYKDTPAVQSLSESGGKLRVVMTGGTDEIPVAPGKFSVVTLK